MVLPRFAAQLKIAVMGKRMKIENAIFMLSFNSIVRR